MISIPFACLAEDVATLLERLRDPDLEAWQQVEQAIWQEWSKSGSPSADFLLERGREAMSEGKNAIAIEHLSALIDHAPEFAEAYNARATAYYQAEMYGPSIEDIGRTLALNPDHFGAMTGLAVILERLGRDRDALNAYRAVAAIHPHRPDVIDGIARLERALGESTL